ncbi:hypothetical protein ES705_45063 [subsurface metagenome]
MAVTQADNYFNLAGNSLTSRVGRQNLRIKVFYLDSLTQILTTRITVLSDEAPSAFRYRIVKQIPHDQEAFTQGLVYYDGLIYEGTGQHGKSRLMKIDPENGTILLERKLGNEFFGEGIVIYERNIFQLTYKSMLGFVYELESFEQIRQFDLQTAEGWGLTTDGHSLIVSEGSSMLYFYDPKYFNQVNHLDVCDNKGLVTSLNELEYVNGTIWANVYGEKFIVQIDAHTGIVIGKLDLTAIIPGDLPEEYSHVLNGIAYNPDNRTFYITGKLWPLIYEIEIFQ